MKKLFIYFILSGIIIMAKEQPKIPVNPNIPAPEAPYFNFENPDAEQENIDLMKRLELGQTAGYDVTTSPNVEAVNQQNAFIQQLNAMMQQQAQQDKDTADKWNTEGRLIPEEVPFSRNSRNRTINSPLGFSTPAGIVSEQKQEYIPYDTPDFQKLRVAGSKRFPPSSGAGSPKPTYFSPKVLVVDDKGNLKTQPAKNQHTEIYAPFLQGADSVKASIEELTNGYINLADIRQNRTYKNKKGVVTSGIESIKQQYIQDLSDKDKNDVINNSGQVIAKDSTGNLYIDQNKYYAKSGKDKKTTLWTHKVRTQDGAVYEVALPKLSHTYDKQEDMAKAVKKAFKEQTGNTLTSFDVVWAMPNRAAVQSLLRASETILNKAGLTDVNKIWRAFPNNFQTSYNPKDPDLYPSLRAMLQQLLTTSMMGFN